MRWVLAALLLAGLTGCGVVPSGGGVEPSTVAPVLGPGRPPREPVPGPPLVRPAPALPRAHAPAAVGDKVSIGSLSLRAALRPVRFVGRELQIPPSINQVGIWSDGAGLADAIGTTVLVGHVSDDADRPGVLARLGAVHVGAVIHLGDRGRAYAFRVTGVHSYPKAGLPRTVFAQAGPHRLVVITCSHKVVRPGGAFHYTRNLVVTARPLT